MPYTVAGIDIHKKVLMVVVAIAGEAIEFECRRFGTGAPKENMLSAGGGNMASRSGEGIDGAMLEAGVA